MSNTRLWATGYADTYQYEPTTHLSIEAFDIVSYGSEKRYLKFPTWAEGERFTIDQVWRKWRWLLPYWVCEMIGAHKAIKYVIS